MKITWVLPQNYDTPIGGYKIVYQYANYLSSIGHHVRIIFLKNPVYAKHSKLYQYARELYWKTFNKSPFRKEVTWFNISSNIEIDWNISSDIITFDQDEKVIATAYWTADVVNEANIPFLNKFYFIQDYEIFSGTINDVDNTWKFPLNKFAVSSWLSDLGKTKFGENVKFIPNFLDLSDNFHVTNDVSNRGNVIALLNHPNERKNTKLGLDIINLVREKNPKVNVKLFGTEDFDNDNYNYIEYFKRPSRKQLRDNIYNQSMIYLLPSEYEGWGLTAMEAMASGDIVISNDNGGVNDFIKNDVNGFIMDFNEKNLVVDKIIEIFKQPNYELAKDATKITNNFSVARSSNKLIDFLSNVKFD
ncbi:glycosyltransferase family 4 protein [Weissella koreensis]|uniref:glycosyltransferase family 4 protein n=1 Tax=Weissella koreensis TaxID=165096 RepID=UPI0022BA4163|nr:glycosyltransferase family 4 protein [Weissella koreensis]MCZ9310872.1 glycosyltransferase family 4 protein [Weissella koreensis]